MRKLLRRSGRSCGVVATNSNHRRVPATRHRRSRATLRAHEVTILTGAAFLVVAAKREHLEIAVTTGDPIAIWPPPRIKKCFRALEIGATPGRNAGRRLHQRRQPDLLGWIAAIMKIEQLEGR